MPNPPGSRALPGPKRTAAILSVLILVPGVRQAEAQISYPVDGEITRLQTILPWQGPGAALLNPAFLGETGKAYGLFGYLSSITAKSGYKTYQLAGAMPMGLAAGFAGIVNTKSIDNSTVLFQENAYVPMLAYGWPPARDATNRFSIGAAMPVFVYNAFDAVKSTTTSLDIGLLWSGNPAPDLGRFRIGLAVTRIIRPEVELPDGRGTYSPMGETNLSLALTSAGDLCEIQASWFAKKVEKNEGPGGNEEPVGLGSWGLMLSPVEWVALKVERPRWGGSSATYGIELRPAPISEGQPSLEFNLGHDKGIHPNWPRWLWGEVQDEGRGFFFSGSIAVNY